VKMSRYADEQIAFTFPQVETDIPVKEVVLKMDIAEQTVSRWKQLQVGPGTSEVWRFKALEEEKRRLKQIVADQALKELISKNFSGRALG
jgi:putative transposase